MRAYVLAFVVGIGAISCIAQSAGASATIEIFWNGTSNTSTSLEDFEIAVADVVVTAGPDGVAQASVSVSYEGVVVDSFESNPNRLDSGALLPEIFGATIDNSTEVENLNAGSLPPYLGPGVAAGESWLVGTIIFRKTRAAGTFEIVPFVRVASGMGKIEKITNLMEEDITDTSSFFSATIIPEPGVTLSALCAIATIAALRPHRRLRRFR